MLGHVRDLLLWELMNKICVNCLAIHISCVSLLCRADTVFMVPSVSCVYVDYIRQTHFAVFEDVCDIITRFVHAFLYLWFLGCTGWGRREAKATAQYGCGVGQL